MTFDEYQIEVERTAPQTGSRERFINFGFGLFGEVGEVVDSLKKTLFQGHPLDRDKLLLELGDCMWYLTAIATTAGLTLAEVVEANKNKLRKRYPNGFTPQLSMERGDVGGTGS